MAAAFVSFVEARALQLYYVDANPRYVKSRMYINKFARIYATRQADKQNKAINEEVRNYLCSDKFFEDMALVVEGREAELPYAMVVTECIKPRKPRTGIFTNKMRYFNPDSKKEETVAIHKNFGYFDVKYAED